MRFYSTAGAGWGSVASLLCVAEKGEISTRGSSVTSFCTCLCCMRAASVLPILYAATQPRRHFSGDGGYEKEACQSSGNFSAHNVRYHNDQRPLFLTINIFNFTMGVECCLKGNSSLTISYLIHVSVYCNVSIHCKSILFVMLS